MRLLLFSNSRTGDAPFLAHAIGPLDALLAGARRIAFVPFAGVTIGWDEYTARIASALAPLGVTVTGVHAGERAATDAPDAARAASRATAHATAHAAAVLDASDAILVGGGNTFHLVAHLHRTRLVDAIRARVRGGLPYAGWSAGAVVSGPSLATTNDMPIVQPASHAALALVPFHVNAHFTDVHPPGFRGETRRERLAEFVTVNPHAPVVGLPEGDWLEVSDARVTLRGPYAAPVFRAGTATVDIAPDAECGAMLRMV